jgi:hypothetical protein
MAAYIENFKAYIFTFFITIEPKHYKVNPTRHRLKMLSDDARLPVKLPHSGRIE